MLQRPQIEGLGGVLHQRQLPARSSMVHPSDSQFRLRLPSSRACPTRSLSGCSDSIRLLMADRLRGLGGSSAPEINGFVLGRRRAFLLLACSRIVGSGAQILSAGLLPD